MNKPLPLESARTTRLLRWLRSTYPRSYWFKVHGNPYQPKVVDIFGCMAGQTIAIEVKRPNRDLTLHQKKTLYELSRSGAVTMRAWDSGEIAKNLQKIAIDKLSAPVYSSYIDGRVSEFGAINSREGESEVMARKSAAPVKSKAKAEDIEELEDLDDLDEEDEDFEDEDEDEDDEDEEDEDDEDEDEDDEPPVKSKKTSKTVAKTATKTKAKAEAPKKARGNPGNLTPRRVAEGMVGAAAIAEELGIDAREVRVHLRKLGTEKSENGLYEWKAGSKPFQAVVKAVTKSRKDTAKAKA